MFKNSVWLATAFCLGNALWGPVLLDEFVQATEMVDDAMVVAPLVFDEMGDAGQVAPVVEGGLQVFQQLGVLRGIALAQIPQGRIGCEIPGLIQHVLVGGGLSQEHMLAHVHAWANQLHAAREAMGSHVFYEKGRGEDFKQTWVAWFFELMAEVFSLCCRLQGFDFSPVKDLIDVYYRSHHAACAYLELDTSDIPF